jgi:hypothetical protein
MTSAAAEVRPEESRPYGLADSREAGGPGPVGVAIPSSLNSAPSRTEASPG